MSIFRLAILAVLLVFQAPQLFADTIAPTIDPDHYGEVITKAVVDGDVEGAVEKLKISLGANTPTDVMIANFKLPGPISDSITDKVLDQAFGTTIRRVTYVVLRNDKQALYFRYTYKKWPRGWALTNFDFQGANGPAFPEAWHITP